MTNAEKLESKAVDIIRWRQQIHIRRTNLRSAEQSLENAEEMLELSIIDYNKILHDTGTNNRTATTG